MKLYGKYFNKYKVPFLAAVLCVTLEAVCDLLGPTLMSNVINAGIEQGSIHYVYYWGARMLLVTLTGACFAISRNILASKVSQRMGADLRYDLFEKIISFSEVSADKIESGSLITRMTNDTSQVIQFVNGIMRIFLKAPVTCVGSIVLASLLNFRLSLIIYGIVVIVAGLIVLSMKLSYPRYYQLQKAMDKVNLTVQEYLIGIRLVKAFGTYDRETLRFEEANSSLMQKGIASQIIITFISPVMTLAVGIGTVVIIFTGSRLFSLNLASPGDVTAFTIYMAQILTSLIMITNIFNTFVRTKASTSRIKERQECGSDFSDEGNLSELNGEIEFSDVTFAYPGGSGVPAIQNLSFKVKNGESLAVIGPTGSGKSTIAWLLLRFYNVNSGKIRINGQDINKLNINTVRNNTAIVPQKAMLFSGSVARNLRWGDKDASVKRLQEAAAAAQADFITRMPKGFESVLGSGGVNLSGGQKQRISIARALLKKSAILLLDDATSALDAVTEAKVRNSLNLKSRNQTVITITQRCGTAMSADRILVMDNGRKAGYGTHRELMQSCQVYQDIYKTQIKSSREA